MQAGDLVRDKNSGTTGVILRPAETVVGHWWVFWGNGFTHMMWDRHIEVISASR